MKYQMHPLKKMKGVIPPIDPEVTGAISRKRLNMPYAAQSPSQELDIYYPEMGEGPFPVIVYFHGGGFAIGAKDDEDLEPMLCALSRGYALVSAEYRKSGEAIFPAALYDAKAVIRFLRARRTELELDTDHLGLWGPSSGGWLVSMLASTEGLPGFEDLSMGNAEQCSGVHAVLDWCGPCGLFSEMDDQLRALGMEPRRPHNDERSPESEFLGVQITKARDLCRLASPMTWVSPEIPPFLIVHGTEDPAVPVTQSIQFAQSIREVAGKDRVNLHLEAGQGHHGTPWYTQDWMIDLALDFFDQHLK